MITEPLMMAIGHDSCDICGDLDDPGWELSCDNCGTRMDIDADPGDQETLERWAREDDGWIVLMDWHYCSLDCLLRHRHGVLVRRLHSAYASDLVAQR